MVLTGSIERPDANSRNAESKRPFITDVNCFLSFFSGSKAPDFRSVSGAAKAVLFRNKVMKQLLKKTNLRAQEPLLARGAELAVAVELRLNSLREFAGPKFIGKIEPVERYSKIRIAVPRKRCCQVTFSVRGPQRQVFVAGVEEKATFETLCKGTFILSCSRNGRDRANCRRRRRCLCAPGNNPGRRPDDRHAAQKALL